MDAPEPRDVTQILSELDGDDREQRLEELWQLVYHELRTVASHLVARERASATLHPSALVSEAYLRLFARDASPTWDNRAHFFGAATRAMRRLLIERARRHGREVDARGMRVTFDGGQGEAPRTWDPIILVESLDRLEAEDARAAEILMLHYFGGLEVDEIARLLELSASTVWRDLAFAKVRVYDEMVGGSG